MAFCYKATDQNRLLTGLPAGTNIYSKPVLFFQVYFENLHRKIPSANLMFEFQIFLRYSNRKIMYMKIRQGLYT